MEKHWKYDSFNSKINATSGTTGQLVSSMTVDDLEKIIESDFEGFEDRPNEVLKLSEIYAEIKGSEEPPKVEGDPEVGEPDTPEGETPEDFVKENDLEEEVDAVEDPLT